MLDAKQAFDASVTRHPAARVTGRRNARIARSRRGLALGKLFSVEYNPNYSPNSCVCVPFICFCNRTPMTLAPPLRLGVYCPLVKERG